MSVHRGISPWMQVPLWAAGNSLAGGVIGLMVALFKQGGVEKPVLVISVLFGNVVGFTAMICSSLLFPRLRGMSTALRVVLLGLALLSGAVVGTVAVLNVYPLFVFGEPRLAAAIVAINATLALIVGGVVYAYEGMRLRLQDSLREVEEVRLVEARLREEAARAELAALQARINPHFFFNTLNTIASLVEDDPDEAGEVVQSLADLFRYTFRVAGAGPVALADELEFTRGYLQIERARFGERLQVTWEVQPAASRAAVPGLILQPLVENAVGHGLAPLSGGGRLRVAATVAAEQLVLEVVDDGVGLEGAREPDGHGLSNVRRRLAPHFDDRATLELEPNPEGRGTHVRLTLPFSEMKDAS